MRAFAALLDRLVLTPQRNMKLRLMTDYLRATPDPDRGYALAALTGDLDIPSVKPAMLRALVTDRVDEALFGYSYDYVGDLAETISLIWPARADASAGPVRDTGTTPFSPLAGETVSASDAEGDALAKPEGGARTRSAITPLPNPPPQGGRETRTARTESGTAQPNDGVVSVPSPLVGERQGEGEGVAAPPASAKPEAGSGTAPGDAPRPDRGRSQAKPAGARTGEPANDPAPPGHNRPPLHLSDIVARLQGASRSEGPRLVEGWLDQLDAAERWALIKLVTGGMRIGVSARLAKQAAADLGGQPVNAIEEVWHGIAPPYTELFAWLEGRGPRPESQVRAPFRPVMLSHALADDELSGITPEVYAAEWKWDGIRVQAVREGDVARLYTRTGDDISHTFPDIVEALDVDAALDGELLVGHRDDAGFVVRSFSDLQQRLNRKTVSAKLLASHPAFLRVYDCLVDAGEDMRTRTFRERRDRLETMVARSLSGRMDLSPLIPFADPDALTALRAAPPETVIEGLMLKRWDSVYEPGRPKGPWFKWKRDPHTVDAVLMYAQRGHGKRSSYYSDYTFGVWRAGEEGDELVPVGKAYFGFTDEELAEIDRFVRNNTINRFGPVREVVHAPDEGLVLEVAFEGLQRSTRHRSGVAMRFPRVSRLRWDKPPAEADRIETLEALLDG